MSGPLLDGERLLDPWAILPIGTEATARFLRRLRPRRLRRDVIARLRSGRSALLASHDSRGGILAAYYVDAHPERAP